MNGYRKMMIEEGGNLSWCKPVVSEDGNVVFAINEGMIQSAMVDGREYSYKECCKPDTVKMIAQRVNSDYADYSGYSDAEIALMAMHEGACCDCPWFSVCDAMDNPDDWEDENYPDD